MQHSLAWSLHDTVQIISLGGACVALQAIEKVCSHNTKMKFPKMLSKISHKNSLQKKLTFTDIPIMDIVDLVDSGKMENCFLSL